MAKTVVDVLSGISGISKEGVHQIFLEVKENHKKLDECNGPHSFTIPAGRRKFADDWVCEKCGGKVSPTDKQWYERGLKHGRQSLDSEES